MSCGALLACSGTATDPSVPPPATTPELSEICTVIEPHRFADATTGFFDAHRHDPAVVGDLDWIADVIKVRRCLCTGQREDCPVSLAKGGGQAVDS